MINARQSRQVDVVANRNVDTHTSPRGEWLGTTKQVTPGKATASLALEYSQLQPVVHVIDDDDAARGSLEFLLDTAGFRVRAYESAVVFLDQISELKPGCIVSDVRMPDITGLELLRRLRDQKIDWPVIIVTGQGDVSLAVESIKSGALDFIEKPYHDEELLGAVRVALAAGDGARAEESAAIRKRLGHPFPN